MFKDIIQDFKNSFNKAKSAEASVTVKAEDLYSGIEASVNKYLDNVKAEIQKGETYATGLKETVETDYKTFVGTPSVKSITDELKSNLAALQSVSTYHSTSKAVNEAELAKIVEEYKIKNATHDSELQLASDLINKIQPIIGK